MQIITICWSSLSSVIEAKSGNAISVENCDKADWYFEFRDNNPQQQIVSKSLETKINVVTGIRRTNMWHGLAKKLFDFTKKCK